MCIYYGKIDSQEIAVVSFTNVKWVYIILVLFLSHFADIFWPMRVIRLLIITAHLQKLIRSEPTSVFSHKSQFAIVVQWKNNIVKANMARCHCGNKRIDLWNKHNNDSNVRELDLAMCVSPSSNGSKMRSLGPIR